VARWRPDVSAGTKLTFAWLSADPCRLGPVIDQVTDLHLTYYPIDAEFGVRADLEVAADLDRMLALSKGKPNYILEAGYPSDGCNVKPGGQLAFFQDFLAASETHRQEVALVSMTWLTDLTDTVLADYAEYYSLGALCFASYLQSLGLRDQTGAAKPVLLWLQLGH
jgi:hypothetical protein